MPTDLEWAVVERDGLWDVWVRSEKVAEGLWYADALWMARGGREVSDG